MRLALLICPTVNGGWASYGGYDAVTKDHLDSVFNGTLAATSAMPAGAKMWGAEPAVVAHVAPPMP